MRKRDMVCGIYLVGLVVVLALVFGVTKTRAYSDHSHHSRTSGGKWPVKDCSDMHMQFDDRDAVVRSEVKTLTKSEVNVLQVRPHRNGGVQVSGWDNDSYEVMACKAARDDGDAERVLSQIHLVVDGAKVSATGPSGEEDWTVYLVVKAPRTAAVDVETENGPVAIYDLGGKLTARAHNGPISLKNFSGDADVRAVNGPISLEGSSGNVRVHTENGPISVDLAGTSWDGAGLSADAQNGPVTLHVPTGYKSSFVVESKGYSPVSCHASICGEARKTWDDDHKRIEYGSGPAVIHMSTVNGPVSVD
jgi:DUF4097 and DUF4098 domain-containing protein YvlB